MPTGPKRYRWIMYIVREDIPGDTGFTLRRVWSLPSAVRVLRRYREETGIERCSALLYPYSEEDWEKAEAFEGIGCPFDYPSKISKWGRDGGLVFVDA